MTIELARQAADAVLYEGYLLYPYRATTAKNQVRWQFGILGPPGAADAGIGEAADLRVECLLDVVGDEPGVGLTLRFLQLQRRAAERAEGGGFVAVAGFGDGETSWLSWDEAVEVERDLGIVALADLAAGRELEVTAGGGEDVELVPGGRLVRRREPLQATVSASTEADDGWLRLRIDVRNTAEPVQGKDAALRRSLIGAHLLLVARGAQFVSVIDPPEAAADAAGRCAQHRCWPVLAGRGGPDAQTSDVVLAAPIILYDFPAVAPESAVAMFDATEIDEILTLRVLTLTDEEKAQARATDAQAAAIIDRCEQMSPEQLQRLHATMRDPHTAASDGDAWWAAEAAAPVSPETDGVRIAGVEVARGSRVRLRPSRRADAQDMFLAGQEARVSGVHVDLDGETHVAVTLVDDPAADLHDWYGRYLYFAPDELEPLAGTPADSPHHDRREETAT
jgi:hypothetical protein